MAKSFKSTNSERPIFYHISALIEAYKLLVVTEDLKKGNVEKFGEKKRALFRSSIITICASWETFLEAAVETALINLIEDLKGPNQVPNNIQARISLRLMERKNPLDLWKISGDNWKKELLTNYQLLIEKFNTPRPVQVDDFILKTLGINNISKNWCWKGQSAEISIKKLNELMDLRGNIVHRVFPNRNIHASTISGYVNFLYRISCISSNVIRIHVHSLTGKYPWNIEKIENIVI